jgi:hypothetical protein
MKQIKFEFTEQVKDNPKTLADVKVNQFFVTIEGCLCQKRTHSSYCFIADQNGEPFSDYGVDPVAEHMPIKRICPEVKHIEF